MSSHTFAVVLGLLVWLTVAITVGVDAAKRGRYGGVWAITTALLGPLGLVIYILAILHASAQPTDTETDTTVRVCSVCEAVNTGRPDRCSACSAPLDSKDEPPSAQRLRSGSRLYCGNCQSRVEPEALICPDCGSQF